MTIILSEGEIMKEINLISYKDLYLITNLGRCFSKRSEEEIKQSLNSGYYCVGLYDINKNYHKFSVHYLVYITLRDDYDKNSKKIIIHLDNNTANNTLANLVYGNFSEIKVVKKTKVVQALDLTSDVVIKEFKTADAASKFIGYKCDNYIRECLKGIRENVGGYRWKYRDETLNEQIKTRYIENLSDFTTLKNINGIDYLNYAINKEGIVINRKLKKKVNSCITKSSYRDIGIVYNLKRKRFYLHRLLGKFFLPEGDKYYHDSNYVINHKDGNKLNNYLDNLEWVTQKKNIAESIGKKVHKMDKKSGIILKTYESLNDAYKDLNKPYSSFIAKVCNGQGREKTAFGFKWAFAH